MSIYITGIGITSSLGIGLDENLSLLIQEKSGLSRNPTHNYFEGKVRLTNEELIKIWNLQDSEYSRTTLLSLMAIQEAWKNNQLMHSIRTGIINGTSVGGLDRMEQHYQNFRKYNDENHLNKMIYDNGYTTQFIAEQLGIKDYVNTLSTACSTGANSIMLGARLIEHNILDRVLVGSCDPLTEFNRKGFESLKIYDDEICKPFDGKRKGLNLGEGSAFLLLENEKSINLTNNIPIVRLAGWHNAADNYHQTASSPDGKGSQITMTKAMNKAGLEPKDISYINAHGTGTPNNDLSESIAISKVFNNKVPPFSSTKGFTGHTLAAAGSIESVFCILSIIKNTIFVNLNFEEPMKETNLIPVTSTLKNENIIHVLTNSFGFGGNCSSLIFSKL